MTFVIAARQDGGAWIEVVEGSWAAMYAGAMVLPSSPGPSFLHSSSGPRLLALDPVRFERWRLMPQVIARGELEAMYALGAEPPDEEGVLVECAGGLVELTPRAGRVVVDACLVDAGREYLRPDWGDGDLTVALGQGRPAGMDKRACDLLEALVTPSAEGKPWWLTATFFRHCNFGLLSPEASGALCGAAKGADAASFGIPAVILFLAELGDYGPRWLLCVEW